MLLVVSGIPQDSIYTGTAFACCIHQRFTQLCIFICPLSFADDTKCFKVINNSTDIQCLQGDLDNLSNWSHNNKLLYNKSKSVHQHFGKSLGSDTYMLNGATITSTNCTKDLGVYLSTNINFSHHYEKITAGTYKILGLL